MPSARAETLRFGDPAPGFLGWAVDEPFGTDLVVAITTSAPLFRDGQALPSNLDGYLGALRAGLATVVQGGGQVQVGIEPLRTEPKAPSR